MRRKSAGERRAAVARGDAAISKSLFPALRLAYLIVPGDLAGLFARARDTLDQYTSTWLQALAADFLSEGYFVRHLRRMRTLYADPRDALVRAVRRTFGDELEVSPAPAGLHLLGLLPDGVDDRAVSRRARAAGLEVPPLSAYRAGRPGRGASAGRGLARRRLTDPAASEVVRSVSREVALTSGPPVR